MWGRSCWIFEETEFLITHVCQLSVPLLRNLYNSRCNIWCILEEIWYISMQLTGYVTFNKSFTSLSLNFLILKMAIKHVPPHRLFWVLNETIYVMVLKRVLLCVLSQFSHTWLCVTLWTIAPPCSSVRGDYPDKNTGVGCHVLLLGIEPTSLMSPTLACGFFTTSATWKAQSGTWHMVKVTVLTTQSCLTLCNPMNCTPPG